MNVSIPLYRMLMRVYPAAFRRRFGAAVDQSFRDQLRDAVERRGRLGVALLWFHVIPDLVFSVLELATNKARNFFQWRFRLQWIVACSLGWLLSMLVQGMIVRVFPPVEGTRQLMMLDHALQAAIFLGSVGLLQSRALAGRFSRKSAWVLYGLAGATLGTIVVGELWIAYIWPSQNQLVMSVRDWFREEVDWIAQPWIELSEFVWRVTIRAQAMVFGALVALCQSAAMRRTPGVRLRWVVASAIGYYLASIAGDYASGYAWQYFVPDDLDLAPPGFLFLPRIISSLAAGVVFGLITCGVIERILFRVQPEAVETA